MSESEMDRTTLTADSALATSARAVAIVDARPVEARELAEAALERATGPGDALARARAFYVIGSSRLHSTDYTGAEADLRRALDIAEEIDDKALIVRIQRALLKCAFFTRNSEAALLRGLGALRMARDAGDPEAEALTRNDLGLVYGNVGDFEGALEHLLAGLRILRESGSRRLARLLNNIGNVYFELGDHRDALGFFESALDAFREEGMPRGEGIALGNIGRANAALRKLDESVLAYEESLAVFERIGDLAYRPPALARLGTALASVGRFEEAEAALDEACQYVDESPHHEFQDEILLAAAHHHLAFDRIDQGIDLLNRALEIIPADEDTRRVYELHALLADAYERKGDGTAALRHFKVFQRSRQAVSESAAAVRIRGLMLQFDVEQARQQEEIFRLRNVELARANEELQMLQAELEEKNRRLHQISVEDPLTGLRNRRFLELQLGVEVKRAMRHRRPLTVAMCDIDRFKAINDRLSHAAGDEVLRRVGEIFRATVRMSDIATRYGGEEFLVILPDTDIAGAELLAERLREAISTHSWDEIDPDLFVTLSIGIAKLELPAGPDDLIALADERLYEAKRAGRNRVVA